MTRFGVMKHLKVLEEAKPRRDPPGWAVQAPLPQCAADPGGRRSLDGALRQAAGPVRAEHEECAGEHRRWPINPIFILETYIRTTPAKLWEALTNPEMTRQYYYGGRVQPTCRVGGKFAYLDPHGEVNLDGEILEIVPEKQAGHDLQGDLGAARARPPRIMFEIEQVGEACKLTITHFDYAKSKAGVESGWPMIIAGLKTLLETGKPAADLPEMSVSRPFYNREDRECRNMYSAYHGGKHAGDAPAEGEKADGRLEQLADGDGRHGSRRWRRQPRRAPPGPSVPIGKISDGGGAEPALRLHHHRSRQSRRGRGQARQGLQLASGGSIEVAELTAM